MRQKTCKVCKTKFPPARPMQTTCSIRCAMDWAIKAAEKKAKQQAVAEKKEIAQRKKALKTRSDWIKETQIAFNRFIRVRDNGRPCISCGTPLTLGGVGGGFDAGHYRSIGSAPHLRFHEWNCHGQCKQCNRYGSGRVVDYRIGLVGRIGAGPLEALEADQTPRKWSIDELKAIRDHYRAKAKALENYPRSPESGAQLGAVSL